MERVVEIADGKKVLMREIDGKMYYIDFLPQLGPIGYNTETRKWELTFHPHYKWTIGGETIDEEELFNKLRRKAILD